MPCKPTSWCNKMAATNIATIESRKVPPERARPSVFALVAIALAASAWSVTAHAQDSWAPVVVSNASRHERPPSDRCKSAARQDRDHPFGELRQRLLRSRRNRARARCAHLLTLAAQTATNSERTLRTEGSPRLMFAWLASTASISPIPQPTRDLHGRRNCWLTSSRRSASESQLLRQDSGISEMAGTSRRVLQEGTGDGRDDLARMKPEAAAAQLVAMDEETAAAVLRDSTRAMPVPF